MKIVFFGTPAFVIPVAKTLNENFELVGVVTAPDQKAGRKQLLTSSPVKSFVQTNTPNVPVLTPQQLDNQTVQQLRALQPDLFVVAAYGKIIPQSFLDIPKYGALNIHPSLLPKYRGASPVQETILQGDKVTGITIMQMDSEMDHGPIVHQKKVALNGDETFERLVSSMFDKSADLVKTTIPEYINGTIELLNQNDKDATYCGHITRKSGYIDTENLPSPEKLDRMIRAYYPWPGVWTKIQTRNGEKIVKFLPENKLQMEGKNPQTIKDFLNGYPETKQLLEKLFV